MNIRLYVVTSFTFWGSRCAAFKARITAGTKTSLAELLLQAVARTANVAIRTRRTIRHILRFCRPCRHPRDEETRLVRDPA